MSYDLQADRAAIRAQILADQAERADGEAHTARTVAIAAEQVPTTWVRKSASWQRETFGGAVFGRREIRRCQRGIEVYRKVDFGRDHHIATWTYEELAQLLNQGRTVVGLKD